MARIIGISIGEEVVEALNLGSGVQAVDVHIAYDELVTVTVKRMVEDHEARAFLKVLAKYRLEEIESDNGVVALGTEVQGMDEEFVRTAHVPSPSKPEAFNDVSAYPFKVRMPDGTIKEYDNHRERTMWLLQWEKANAPSP